MRDGDGKKLILLFGLVGFALAALAVDETTSSPTPSPMPVDNSPVDVSANEAAAHQAARPILLAAFQQTLGRDPTLAELQYAHAVTFNETRYGQGWSQPEMQNANNWGAVSCNPANMSPDVCIPGQVDHFPDGTAYQTGFRQYPTPVDGAADAIANIMTKRPRTAAALSSDAPTFFRASFAMRREKYYGGFCPQATAQYGADATKTSFMHPDQDEASLACQQEAVTAHALAMFRTAKAVAQTLGEPLAMPLGTYEDAQAWYQGGSA